MTKKPIRGEWGVLKNGKLGKKERNRYTPKPRFILWANEGGLSCHSVEIPKDWEKRPLRKKGENSERMNEAAQDLTGWFRGAWLEGTTREEGYHVSDRRVVGFKKHVELAKVVAKEHRQTIQKREWQVAIPTWGGWFGQGKRNSVIKGWGGEGCPNQIRQGRRRQGEKLR